MVSETSLANPVEILGPGVDLGPFGEGGGVAEGG